MAAAERRALLDLVRGLLSDRTGPEEFWARWAVLARGCEAALAPMEQAIRRFLEVRSPSPGASAESPETGLARQAVWSYLRLLEHRANADLPLAAQPADRPEQLPRPAGPPSPPSETLPRAADARDDPEGRR